MLQGQSPFQNPLTINTEKGLPTNEIFLIKEDSRGFMWIGTREGLILTDGINVKTYTNNEEDSTSIKGNYIIEILPDLEYNCVWVCTTEGISKLNLLTQTFKNYEHNPYDSLSVPDFRPESIIKDKNGDIWIGFRDVGMIKYNRETDDFQHHLCPAKGSKNHSSSCRIWVNEIGEDLENDSIMWLGTERGIARYNKYTQKYSRYIFETTDPEENRYANAIRRMLVHPNGKIYAGSWYEGVHVFDKITKKMNKIPVSSESKYRFKPDDVTNGFLMASDSSFWINTNHGCFLYNWVNEQILEFYENDFSNKKHYSIDYIDSKGRIWSKSLGFGLGIRIYDPATQMGEYIRYAEEEDPLGYITRGIIEDTVRKKLYVLSQGTNGLHVYDQKTKTWETITLAKGYNEYVKNQLSFWDGVLMPDGMLLLIDERKIISYTPGNKFLEEYPLQPSEFPRLKNIIRDRQGIYWISGYQSGLIRLDHNNQKLKTIDLSHLEKRWNRQIGGDFMALDKNGNIWMREHYGILVYRTDVDSIVYFAEEEHPITYRGMGTIEALPNGDVWISTFKDELLYAHADSMELGPIRAYGKKEGFKGRGIYKTFYTGSNLLVFSDIGYQEFDINTRKFVKSVAGEYGLGTHIMYVTPLSSGKLAIGKRKQIVVFDPEVSEVKREIPKPYISSFKIFDRDRYLDTDITDIDSIYLKPNENFFTFGLSALGFTLPHKTKFKYMLEGFDVEWREGTELKSAAYTNVPGGNYKFLFQVYDEDHSFSPVTSTTQLFVSTVWWKTIWFQSIAGIWMIVLTYFIYRYRILQVRKEEQLKSTYEKKLANVEMSALRAQMNPHFIFNSLNSIEYYIINNEPEKASDYLNRFSRLIRLILQNSKSTKVPLKDDLEALKLYIEMEAMRFDNLFDYEVKIESGISMEEIHIPPMLIQPYVENAIWHGLMQKKDGKGKIDLTIRRVNGQLNCYIKDNGIGRNAADNLKSKSATERKSFGMKITSDRLHLLNNLVGANAAVEVIDLYNENGHPSGTEVKLTIPINESVNNLLP